MDSRKNLLDFGKLVLRIPSEKKLYPFYNRGHDDKIIQIVQDNCCVGLSDFIGDDCNILVHRFLLPTIETLADLSAHTELAGTLAIRLMRFYKPEKYKDEDFIKLITNLNDDFRGTLSDRTYNNLLSIGKMYRLSKNIFLPRKPLIVQYPSIARDIHLGANRYYSFEDADRNEVHSAFIMNFSKILFILHAHIKKAITRAVKSGDPLNWKTKIEFKCSVSHISPYVVERTGLTYDEFLTAIREGFCDADRGIHFRYINFWLNDILHSIKTREIDNIDAIDELINTPIMVYDYI